MSRDLTIRLLGRPQVSTDKRTGFSKMSRRYVVQGPRASLSGIVDSTNPLFLPVGSADEEFTNYYLIEQTLAPASGTLDKAYLVREYLQISTSAIQEAYTQTNDLIRVRKRFAVLRNNDATLGYGTLWDSVNDKHPITNSSYIDPWEYAPAWIRSATPGSKNYTVDNADDGTQHGFAESPQVEGQNLGTYIQSHASSGDWMEGYSVMTQAGSGLDVWTVEWVTHAAPYWVLGTGRGGRSRTSSANVVDFGPNGVSVTESIGSSGEVSFTTRAMTYNFFVRASSIPSNLAQIGGGSASVSFTPTVNFDLVAIKHNDEVILEKQVSKGSVWGGSITSVELFDADGAKPVEIVDSHPGNSLVIAWQAKPTKPVKVKDPSGEEVPQLDDDGNDVMDFQNSDFRIYKGVPIKSINGTISWTMTKTSYSWSSSSGTFGQTKTAIAPIFSKGSEKIWKVAITYVGG